MAGVWDLAPPAGRTVWDAAPAVGTAPIAGRQAQDFRDAVFAGMQNSATGLYLRGKLPEQQIGEDAPWYHRLAANAAGVVADLPLSVVGAAGGATAGTAVSPGVGTVVGGGAGAFGLPMALRDALIEAYNNDHALSWSGVWEIAKAALKGGAKGAVIGGATAGVGRAIAPALARAGGSPGAVAVGTAGAELSALTATASALEGHMPTWQDFMDNALLLGGMKASMHVARGMRNVFAETGKTPAEVLRDAARDPKLKEELTQAPKLESGGAEPVAAGMTRVYHGGDPRGVAGDLWFTSSLQDAKGWASRGEGMSVWYTDIPTKMLGGDLANGIAPMSRIEVPAEYANRRQLYAPNAAGLPPQYGALALEQRIKAAIDADPRPDMIREALSGKELPKLDAVGMPDPVKYEYITDKDTATGVLRAVTEIYSAEIGAQTRGIVPNKQTAIEGLKMISSGEIGQHVIGEAASAAEIYGRAHLLKGATNHAVRELEKLAATPEADLTPAAKLTALAALERVSMLKAEIEGVGAEAGRALQIFRAIKRDPSFLGEADTLLKLAERKGAMQDVARLVATLKDPAQVAEFARRYSTATTIEKVQEAWKAAILSGPQTHLANILGNAMKWVVEIPEATIAASLTAVNQAAKGNPLSLAQWKARAFAPLYGLQHGAREALHVAAEVWRWKGETLEKADVYRVAIEGKKGEVIRLPFKLLQVEDALFRTVAERAESYKMAVDRVTKEGLHPETIEGRERVVQYTARPELGLSEKAGLEAIAKVEQAGAEAVFSQRLGPNMEIAQRAMAGTPLGFIVPFVRTPANLVSWAVQHTPGLNLLSGRWRADWAAGGEPQARAIARVVIGTGLAMTAYELAKDGLLTGGGMFDKEERGTKTAAGWQQYSIKVGDRYYSYQRIEPVAKVLGIAADLVEMMESKKLEPDDTGKAMLMLVAIFGNATVSTTYLSGLSNTIQATTDPDRYAQNFAEQYASSLVPKIIGQTVALADPHKREVDGVMDAIQSQLPFLREKLLPKRDVWGEPAKNDRWFDVMPVATSQVSEDKVRTEAVRLHMAIADAPRFLQEKGPFNPRDKRVEMTGEQRDIFREVSGKNAMAILGPIVNAPDWERIPDFAKAEIYKHVIEGTRKRAQYAALPPDADERVKLRQKIVDRVISETQKVER